MARKNIVPVSVAPAAVKEREAAQYLGVSPDWLRQSRVTHWRKPYEQPKGPAFIRIGTKGIRYRLADLDEWLDSRVVRQAG